MTVNVEEETSRSVKGLPQYMNYMEKVKFDPAADRLLGNIDAGELTVTTVS